MSGGHRGCMGSLPRGHYSYPHRKQNCLKKLKLKRIERIPHQGNFCKIEKFLFSFLAFFSVFLRVSSHKVWEMEVSSSALMCLSLEFVVRESTQCNIIVKFNQFSDSSEIGHVG